MHPSVGTRQNATINSNRWASRTPSQRRHQKNWVPPPLSEQSEVSDKITKYSNEDYIIGESSKALLQKIAHRFNNGPNPVQVVPELDTNDFRAPVELDPGHHGYVLHKKHIARDVSEILGIAELEADNDDRLTELANRSILRNTDNREDGFF